MYSIRKPVVDWKYACLINFPIRHAFEHEILYTIFKLEPGKCKIKWKKLRATSNTPSSLPTVYHLFAIN